MQAPWKIKWFAVYIYIMQLKHVLCFRKWDAWFGKHPWPCQCSGGHTWTCLRWTLPPRHRLHLLQLRELWHPHPINFFSIGLEAGFELRRAWKHSGRKISCFGVTCMGSRWNASIGAAAPFSDDCTSSMAVCDCLLWRGRAAGVDWAEAQTEPSLHGLLQSTNPKAHSFVFYGVLWPFDEYESASQRPATSSWRSGYLSVPCFQVGCTSVDVCVCACLSWLGWVSFFVGKFWARHVLFSSEMRAAKVSRCIRRQESAGWSRAQADTAVHAWIWKGVGQLVDGSWACLCRDRMLQQFRIPHVNSP